MAINREGEEMSIETCANCGSAIGKLEQACVFEGNVVCAACNSKLRKKPEVANQDPAAIAEGVIEQKILKQSPAPFRGNLGLSCLSVLFIVSSIVILLFMRDFWVAAAILAPTGLVTLFLLWIKSKFTVLLINDKLIRSKKGIISRAFSEVQHSDVRNIQVKQGALDRILGIGMVQVGTAAIGEMEITLRAMANPNRIAEMIRQYQD